MENGSPVPPRFPTMALADVDEDAADPAMNGDEDDYDDEFSDFDVDDDNPFEALAATQASQGELMAADVNLNMISRARDNPDDVDEEEIAREQHQRDVRQRAEEGAKFRATQMPRGDGNESDEYRDEELDELFRKTVAGGWSNHTTPRKRNGIGLATPSTGSRSNLTVGSSERRDRMIREQAGLGDLR